MGLYEIMFILRPEMETEEHEEVLNGLKNTITGNGGTVDKFADWRKRRLAYEIEDHVEGHYYLVYFNGHGSIIPEIEHFFKVNDAILRFLVVRVEEDYYEAAIAEEPAAEEEITAPVEPEEEGESAAPAVDADQEPEQSETAAETAGSEETGNTEEEQPAKEADKE